MIHVVYRKESKRWFLVDSDANEDIGSFFKKTTAIKQGREAAKERHTELKIHRMDGVISQSISYGNDPRGVRG